MTQPVKSFKKGYRFRIYPTPDQVEPLAQAFGSARFVYNTLLARSKEAYEAQKATSLINPTQTHNKPQVSGYDFTSALPALKVEYPWLKDVSSVALQQACLHLGQAYTKFFANIKARRPAGYPKFKSRRDHQSISLTTSGFTLREGELRIAKLVTPLSVIWSRELPSDPTSLTLTMTPSGEYHVAFICEYAPAKTTGTKITGIDLGLTHLAILSDGTKITNPKHYQKAQCRLKRLQQRLSKKTKGSKNRNKARLRVAQLHTHISAQRNDHLHKLSRRLVNENQVLGIETLRVANMVRNHKLAKHIQSAAWQTLTTQIAYKARESQHCVVVMMDPYFPSSHLCAATGKHLGRKLALSERTWDCPHCGEVHDRDVNAAQNIAAEAMAQCEHYGFLRAPHTGTVYIASKLPQPL